MVDITQAFPSKDSKYLKSVDLQGGSIKVTIARVLYETIGKERKLVAHFTTLSKFLVLNKTNAHAIGDVYGSNTDLWVGKVIELYPTTAEYQGETYEVIRVRVPPRPPAAPAIGIPPKPTVILQGGAEIVEDAFADLEPDPEF